MGGALPINPNSKRLEPGVAIIRSGFLVLMIITTPLQDSVKPMRRSDLKSQIRQTAVMARLFNDALIVSHTT